MVCVGANSLFTGLGYGFDGTYLTGAEFTIQNARLNEDLEAGQYTMWAGNETMTHK